MTAPRRFEGVVALVTGGASGIGRAIVERAAKEGAKTAILDKAGEAGEKLAEELSRAGHGAFAVAADITDDAAVAAAVAKVTAAVGPIGILVNNAGATRVQTFGDMDPVAWRAEIEINLSGAYYVTRSVLPSMLTLPQGAIVNVATVNALTTISEPAYSAAKAGLLQFTRQLAVDYGPRGIRANSVVPGSIRTPAWGHRLKDRPKLLDVLRRWYPVGRIGEPEDVAAAVLFLASAEAGFINGASLVVDGGLTAGLPQMANDISGAG